MCLGNNLLVRRKNPIKFVAILKPDVCIISGRQHFSRVLSVANSASKTKQCIRGTRIPFTLPGGPSQVKARICARDPLQQYFFCVPHGISTEAPAWHITQEHTNLMNSRTPSITHFVEHSTGLYECKS